MRHAPGAPTTTSRATRLEHPVKWLFHVDRVPAMDGSDGQNHDQATRDLQRREALVENHPGCGRRYDWLRRRHHPDDP